MRNSTLPRELTRVKESALVTQEEIASVVRKQWVTIIRRIFIRKGEERIQTNTYILTFNQLRIPKKVKIGYCLERVEQYVSALLKCFKCQKYGHHSEACRGRQTCAKCSENDPDHGREDFLKEIRCANCRQDHPTYSTSYVVYKERNEITEVKNKKNVFFLKARRIVENYMGENNYASVAGGRIESMKKTNIEHSWRNWSCWKPMIGQSFRSTWKNYTRSNFTKHKLCNKLGMERDPML